MQRKLLMMIDVKFFELYLKFMQSKKIIQTRQAVAALLLGVGATF